MFNPNDGVTLGLGMKMNKFFLRLAFAVAVLLPMPSALAADLDEPAPELRAASFDWSGPYIGVFGTAVAVDGDFDGVCSCGAAHRPALPTLSTVASAMPAAFWAAGIIRLTALSWVLKAIGPLAVKSQLTTIHRSHRFELQQHCNPARSCRFCPGQHLALLHRRLGRS